MWIVSLNGPEPKDFQIEDALTEAEAAGKALDRIYCQGLDPSDFRVVSVFGPDQFAMLRTYPEDVQACINKIVEFAERAESANQQALSGWYGSLCKWVRERQAASKPFTVTLPDPEHGGDPLTVIEVRTTL